MSLAPEVEAVARFLAKQPDDETRQRVLKQIALRSASVTPEESLGRPPIQTLAEYMATEIEVPPRLVEPALLVRGGIFCITGAPGKGKTTFMLNAMLAWAAGRRLFGDLEGVLEPTAPLRSLIVENEGAAGEFHRNIGVMLNRGPLSPSERATAAQNVLVWGDGGWSGLKLDEPAQLDRLRRGVEQHKPDILFIEPFHGLWSGDENSNTEMRNVLDAMQALASEQGMAVCIAHHERKSGVGEDGEAMYAARGAGALSGAVTVMSGHKPVKGGELREWATSKSRHAPQPGPVRMTYNGGTHWYEWVPEQKGETEVLGVLADAGGETCFAKDIADELDEPVRRVRDILNALAAARPDQVKKTPRSYDQGVGFRLVNRNDDTTGALGI